MTNEELMDAWRRGNNAGHGWAVGREDMTPIEAALDVGLEHVRTISPEGGVVGKLAGDIIVVADSHGPWAVTIVTARGLSPSSPAHSAPHWGRQRRQDNKG